MKIYEETPATYENVEQGSMVIVGWWAPVEHVTYKYNERITVSYRRGGGGGSKHMTAEEFDACGYLLVPPGGLLLILPVG